METIIIILFSIVVLEMLLSMYYANKFHARLITKYHDHEKLTIFVGSITGFRAIKNLLSNNEKFLNDEFLTRTKLKSRFWLYATLLTMVVIIPLLISIISIALTFINDD